jgi:cytochrome P450
MLDVKNISKTFFPGTINEKKALTDLSLHLEAGRFCDGHRWQRRRQIHASEFHFRSAEG